MVIRKLLCVVCAALLLPWCTAAYAINDADGGIYGNARAVAAAEASALQYAIAYEADTALDVAGLCRLPALMYICEAADKGAFGEERTVTVCDEAASVAGPTAFIEAGEKISAQELIKAAVMITAGDACYALAKSAAGSASLAEEAIKQKLSALGVGCGDYTLKDGKRMMSAKELCALAAKLAASPTYRKYSALALDEITHENGSRTELVNPNKLIKSLSGCIGGSTGSANEAGYSGIIVVEREGVVYVAALIGAKDAGERSAILKDAAETAFASFVPVKAANKGDVIARDIPVAGGMSSAVNGVAAADALLLMRKDAKWSVLLELDTLTAPVCAGDAVGRAQYSSGDETEPVSITIIAQTDVKSASLMAMIMEAMRRWVHA